MKTSNLVSGFPGITSDYSVSCQEAYDTVGPCHRPGGIYLTERALNICELPPGSYIADIGCGAGGTLEYLTRTGLYRGIGLDCEGKVLERIESCLGYRCLVQGRAETLPFKAGSFDALFCECVLSILSDRFTALCGFAGAVKENGFLVVSDVFGRFDPGRGRKKKKSQGIRTAGLLEKRDLFRVLAELGFKVVQWEEYPRLLKEFIARTILAGGRFPDPRGCAKQPGGNETDRPKISYFLLIAKKSRACSDSIETLKRG